jgi:hypothetical protein
MALSRAAAHGDAVGALLQEEANLVPKQLLVYVAIGGERRGERRYDSIKIGRSECCHVTLLISGMCQSEVTVFQRLWFVNSRRYGPGLSKVGRPECERGVIYYARFDFAGGEKRQMRLLGIAFLVAGLLIITAGAVLLNILSGNMDKLPGDYRHEEVFEGTYQVLDPATGSLDEYQVTVHRVREVIRTEGDAAVVRETVTTTDPAGESVPGFDPVQVTLKVDRNTFIYYPPGLYVASDRFRGGYMVFPPNVRRDTEYITWFPDVSGPVPARFDHATDVNGLDVYVFKVDAQDMPVLSPAYSDLPTTGDVQALFKVEPRSGLVVDTEYRVTIRGDTPQGEGKVVFSSTLGLTDDTVSDNVAKGKADRFELVFINSYVPWLIMGLGMLFGFYGVILIGFDRWRKRSENA